MQGITICTLSRNQEIELECEARKGIVINYILKLKFYFFNEKRVNYMQSGHLFVWQILHMKQLFKYKIKCRELV